MRKILFIGDSITDGGRKRGHENEWDLNHQMGHCYAYLINAQIGADNPELNFVFVNRGIDGNRIIDLYARLQEDVISQAPDYVSILIGINDCGQTVLGNGGSEPKRFERVYRLILEEIQEKLPYAKLILCEPFILPVGAVKDKYEKWLEAVTPLQEITKKLSQEYNSAFIPLQTIFTEACQRKDASYWIWDGVHPTVCGHALIAREWLNRTAVLFVETRPVTGNNNQCTARCSKGES